jgi:hypothetical protein
VFIETCESLKTVKQADNQTISTFLAGLLAPNIDARIFEIVSYAILKSYYGDKKIYFGWSREEIEESLLVLYKTGRTNANDGGIDFVMRPLGRFFQVTETLDVRKYFLDIDKVERFPISFVIKSTASSKTLENDLKEAAKRIYSVEAIVSKYMSCIEEIINIPTLLERLQICIEKGDLISILEEVILQSKVEFNYEEDEEPEQGSSDQ